jgi:hypothetical protein
MQNFNDIANVFYPFCCLIIGIVTFGIIGLNMLANSNIRKKNKKYQDDQISWGIKRGKWEEINSQLTLQVNNEKDLRQIFIWAKGLATQDQREINTTLDLLYTDPTNPLATRTMLATIAISRLISLGETNEDAAKYILELIKLYPHYLPFQTINDSNSIYAGFFLNKLAAKKESSSLLVRLVAHALVGGMYSPEQIQTINRIQDAVYFQDYQDLRDNDGESGYIFTPPTIGDASYWDFLPEHSSSDSSYQVTGKHTLRQTIKVENEHMNFLMKFSRGS